MLGGDRLYPLMCRVPSDGEKKVKKTKKNTNGCRPRQVTDDPGCGGSTIGKLVTADSGMGPCVRKSEAVY